MSQSSLSLPEVIAGERRQAGQTPTRFVHSCQPQAWAAAAIPFLLRLHER